MSSQSTDVSCTSATTDDISPLSCAPNSPSAAEELLPISSRSAPEALESSVRSRRPPNLPLLNLALVRAMFPEPRHGAIRKIGPRVLGQPLTVADKAAITSISKRSQGERASKCVPPAQPAKRVSPRHLKRSISAPRSGAVCSDDTLKSTSIVAPQSLARIVKSSQLSATKRTIPKSVGVPRSTSASRPRVSSQPMVVSQCAPRISSRLRREPVMFQVRPRGAAEHSTHTIVVDDSVGSVAALADEDPKEPGLARPLSLSIRVGQQARCPISPTSVRRSQEAISTEVSDVLSHLRASRPRVDAVAVGADGARWKQSKLLSAQ